MDIFLKVLPYLVNLLSGIILACATYTINKARTEHEQGRHKEEEDNKALRDGVQALLRESIVSNYRRYHDRGDYCSVEEKESSKRAWEAYSRLGGNDVAHALYNKILAMPTEPEV